MSLQGGFGRPTVRRARALVDRAPELRALDAALVSAAEGAGTATVVEAALGYGKTALLDAAAARSATLGCPALRATGTRLERGFPFGVAIQLLERHWLAADDAERAAFGAGPAHVAGALLEGRLDDVELSTEQAYRVIRGLFWLMRNLLSVRSADEGRAAVTVLVDDAQWADEESLRFLAYLAARQRHLPIALIVAMRRPEPDESEALSELRHSGEASTLRPGPLTDDGIAGTVRSRFPDADDEMVSACAEATGGSPLLLDALLTEIRRAGHAGDRPLRVSELLPAPVGQAVAVELRAMSDRERALAQAVAVLGDGVTISDAAGLAELDIETASLIADALAARGLLEPTLPLRFAHAIVRTAVARSIPEASRRATHGRAADVLEERGAAPTQVAGHLLVAPAQSDPDAVRALRSAARDKLRGGQADEAARFLNRALQERPSEAVHAELVGELGEAEAAAGGPHASERLREAMALTGDPTRRAELALARGRVLLSGKQYEESAATVAAGLRDLGAEHSELEQQLQAVYISAASHVRDLAPEASRRRHRLLERIGSAPDGQQRTAIAHSVVQDSLRGANRNDVRGLTEIAWADGAFLQLDPGVDPSLSCLASALMFVDEIERDLEICEIARTGPHRISAPVVSHFRAWPLYERGQITEAIAEAKAALDAPDDFHTTIRTAYATLACCHLLQGDLAHAETALAIVEDPHIRQTVRHPVLLEVRSRLRLRQHRPEHALADALHAGELLESDYGVENPGAVAWRSTAALAHLALGQPARAGELAAAELERAERIDVTRVVIRDLRVLGLAAGGQEGIDLLRHAVEIGDRYPPRLEAVHATLEFGAALRRAKQRADAREPLRRVLAFATEHGATTLAERARTELAATGSRSRTVLLTGVDSLTPSERRVANHAAQGMTTRQIAEALFISRKTVEYHLRHIYQKLEISSRAELTAVLQQDLKDQSAL